MKSSSFALKSVENMTVILLLTYELHGSTLLCMREIVSASENSQNVDGRPEKPFLSSFAQYNNVFVVISDQIT